MRNAMILIAVSKYVGDVKDLPGTLVSAKRLKDWAEKQGDHQDYLTLEISDRDGRAVTVDRVRTEFTNFVDDNFIDRLVIYFAGHGVSGVLPGQKWLLTNAARDNSEAIDVERLKLGLHHSGIGAAGGANPTGQIIIISDACRNISSLSATLHGHPIYTRSTDQPRKIQQDRYYSTLAHDVSLHINARDGWEPYCLFSQLLLDALSGRAHGVGSLKASGEWELSNFELADYLEKALPARSQQIANHRCDADAVTAIRPDKNVYASMSVAPSGAGFSPPEDTSTPNRSTQMSWRNKLSTLVNPRSDRKAWGSLTAYGMHYQPEDQEEYIAPSVQLIASNDVGNLYGPKGLKMLLDERIDGVVVRSGQAHANPLLVETTGRHVLVPKYPNVVPQILPDYPLEYILNLVGPGGGRETIDTTMSDRLNRMRGTRLRVKDATHAADRIRSGKSYYPHFGVVASYLYDFTGDLDNIARVAHFLAEDFASELPFDVALLCADRITWSNSDTGLIQAWADLPEVTESPEPQSVRPGDKTRPRYTRIGFSARNRVPLWGACPIVRQGWLYLSDIRHYKVPIPLQEIAKDTQGDVVTLFGERARDIFNEYFRYELLKR